VLLFETPVKGGSDVSRLIGLLVLLATLVSAQSASQVTGSWQTEVFDMPQSFISEVFGDMQEAKTGSATASLKLNLFDDGRYTQFMSIHLMRMGKIGGVTTVKPLGDFKINTSGTWKIVPLVHYLSQTIERARAVPSDEMTERIFKENPSIAETLEKDTLKAGTVRSQVKSVSENTMSLADGNRTILFKRVSH
jgi:hypothetical protein